MWDNCGMARNAHGLRRAMRVLGENETLNQSLEKAGRVADFFELAELMCQDALHREESCGGHFREEYQTADHEALRDDDNFAYVAAWEYNGLGEPETLHREDLVFAYVKPTSRSYK
jgi:succinate dehydrogenase / fumarate reductase flavoprotein subunit